MRKFLKPKTVLLALAVLAPALWAGFEATRAPYEGRVGTTQSTAFSVVRQSDIRFDIWYPTQGGGKAVVVGGNGVFLGTVAGRDAPPRAGQHPMIALSHGAGGNSGQFGWIASALVEAGFVVVLPNHPGSTSHNASAEAALRVWERPTDVSAVLDEITANPDRYPFIDPNQMGVLGFSAGGYTALALSGARVDPDRLQRFCDSGARGMSDCAFFAKAGIDLHKFDMTPAAQDLRDNRLRFAVVVDPGIVETLTSESLSAITLPMLVINLGEEASVPRPVYARPLSQTVKNADYTTVSGATHFSFLAECTQKGAAILVEEGEADPLCADAGQISRSDLHKALATQITAFVKRVTAP